MPRIPFEQLPDTARLWVFGSSRALTEAEEAQFLGTVDTFLETWAAHGAPLTVGREWRDGRFLHVAVDEASVPPSGCSIDAMVNTLKGVEKELDVVFVDNGPVWFRSADGIGRVSRADFRALVEAGSVTPDTKVFDNSVTRVSELRSGSWERPARDAWHGKAFFRNALR